MEINYLAVLVCGIASMVVGFAWYGPLFGKIWMNEIMGAGSMTPEQVASAKKSMWMMYLIQLILSLITAGVLAFHIANWSDPTASALLIAVCTWFGFVMTTNAGAALWSGKPKATAIKMFLISAGAQLVTFVIYGIILGMWI
jgi:predicted neutral ceramidase superfamily lipid hydrolase